MSRRQQYSTTDRLGVNAVERQILAFGWIFREQPVADHGIDAEVEICDDGSPTGKLLKLQIKSGDSWFRERIPLGIVYRETTARVEYWRDYSIPVLLVLYNPDSDLILWQHVNARTIEPTGRACKLVIPNEQTLSLPAATTLRNLTDQRSTISTQTPTTPPKYESQWDASRHIAGAKYNICVASSRLSGPLLDALLAAALRGVSVRLVLASEDEAYEHSLASIAAVNWQLRSPNLIEARSVPIMSLRQIAVDGATVIYGLPALHWHHARTEPVFVSRDKVLLSSIERAFEQVWRQASAPSNSAT